MPTLHPTTELVAQHWLSSLPTFAGGMVATSLPGDATKWAENGFITVTTVGGSPDIDIPMRRPVVQVDCWANTPQSNKPAWNKANNLAERVLAALQHPSSARTVVLPGEYADAQVQSAYALTEPRKVPDDPAGYAHYTFDIHIHWSAMEAVA